MAPQLGLVYRSTGGNGWFGMGWDLEGFAYIERSSKFGVPNYNDLDSYTLYINGSSYELVRDIANTTGRGYYHTKNETWMRINFDGIVWTVTEPNGRESRFGYTSDSRVPMVGHASYIRLWAVDRVMDKSGNYMSKARYMP